MSLVVLSLLVATEGAAAAYVAQPGFGENGRAFVPLGQMPDGSANSLVPQADGGAITVGTGTDGDTRAVSFLRLTPNGLRDPAFRPTGTRYVSLDRPRCGRRGPPVQRPDGRPRERAPSEGRLPSGSS